MKIIVSSCCALTLFAACAQSTGGLGDGGAPGALDAALVDTGLPSSNDAGDASVADAGADPDHDASTTCPLPEPPRSCGAASCVDFGAGTPRTCLDVASDPGTVQAQCDAFCADVHRGARCVIDGDTFHCFCCNA